MAVRLYDYVAPGQTLGHAFRAAVNDVSARGDTIDMPAVTVPVDESFTVPETVTVHIPRGGAIQANGTLVIAGRVVSEATAPFSGTVNGA